MLSISLNLSKYRLHVKFVNRRGPDVSEPILPGIDDIKSVKKGHKISRFFRHVFEHKNIRKILGTNLALMLIASSFVTTNAFEGVEAEENVISEQSVPLTTKRVIQYPTKKIKVTQGYKIFHPGLDLDGVTGDKIRPVKDGKVEAIQYSKYAYGNAVIVNHGENTSSLYAHLSKINVKEGQEVTTNTIIGEMGATGRAFGDHLHLEIYQNGRPINPNTVLPR